MTEQTHSPLVTAIRKLGSDLQRDVLPIIGRLPAYGKLVYALITSNELSTREKAPLMLALGYQISPVDLIPGFIPVIGQLDDLLVMLWGLRRTLEILPPDKAEAILASVSLSREQLTDDAETIRRTLHETVARGAKSAGRGVTKAVNAGISGAAFLGYFAYYAFRPRRKP